MGVFFIPAERKKEIFLKEKLKKESNQSKWNEKMSRAGVKYYLKGGDFFDCLYTLYIFEMKFSFVFLFEFFHKNMNLFWWGCALLSNCGAFQPQNCLGIPDAKNLSAVR